MKWRILYSGIASAAENMAIDEAILQAHRDRLAPPTIRFYGWQPAAVSLGYFQRATSEIDLERCRAEKVDVVRRLTGGRAVLHDQELTYSVIVNEEHPLLPSTITASYLLFSSALVGGLRKLGVNAAMTTPQAAYGKVKKTHTSSACFDAPSHYELTAEGRKLAGSAQVRKDGILLQHGSILLSFCPERLAALLRLSEEQRDGIAELLAARAVALDELLGRTVGWREAAEAVEGGFRRVLPVEVETGSLSEHERKTSRSLVNEKYGCAAWTMLR
ncbi:lipoate--protein ligase family protein [Azotosporobacter soli]|uniref:lipoate--protein ligase family protein n=1 Tax=Azotosporobacter soli TaxID=3055040 RepID=UPI0031FEDAD9